MTTNVDMAANQTLDQEIEILANLMAVSGASPAEVASFFFALGHEDGHRCSASSDTVDLTRVDESELPGQYL